MLSPSIDALMTGTARIASTTALRMNERNVSFAPAASNSAFFASRIFATREKLTSKTECTCADVRRLMTMCSAILFRITDILTISTTGPLTRSAATRRPAPLAVLGRSVPARPALPGLPAPPAPPALPPLPPFLPLPPNESKDVVFGHAT